VNHCDCGNLGYNGTQCELPICNPPCLHSGICTSPNTCSCPYQWDLPGCSKPICIPPCFNGGACSAGPVVPFCDCNSTGFNGAFCQAPILPPTPPPGNNSDPFPDYTDFLNDTIFINPLTRTRSIVTSQQATIDNGGILGPNNQQLVGGIPVNIIIGIACGLGGLLLCVICCLAILKCCATSAKKKQMMRMNSMNMPMNVQTPPAVAYRDSRASQTSFQYEDDSDSDV